MSYSVEQQIFHHALRTPQKVALQCGKSSITYCELCDKVVSAARCFEQLPDYEQGGRVMLAANKGVGFVIAYLGVHLAKLTAVPIDAETNLTRFNHIKSVTSPLLVIGFDKYTSEEQTVSLAGFCELDGGNELDHVEFPDLPSVADIMFTTGTTGEPKGVPLTYRNEAAAARNINTYIGTCADDTELLALPISHSFGLGRLRCCLSAGATLILEGSFVNVKRIFRLMSENRVSGFTMVPASWKFLQKVSGNRLADFASQLKYIEMGSAYLSPSDKQELADLFPRTKVAMHYGLTEASRSAFLDFHKDSGHLDSVGKAAPHTDIQLFDENGRMLPPCSEGEICVKGDHVTEGYVGTPAASLFWNGYFRTGDWGMMDEEGFIHLLSRKKDLINVGGKKVSPVEVETQLLRFEGVADCACVAAEDKDGVLGEVVKAFIVKQQGFDFSTEELSSFLLDKLESYKIPVEWQYVDEIPKTQNGKKQRNLLK